MIEHKNEKGELHRTDGPAVVRADGYQAWYLNDKLHRGDGPAVEYGYGYREWWVDGKRHRTDGPAFEYKDGSREWWVDGKLHCTDGPAVDQADGYQEWWVEGEFIKYAQSGERKQKREMQNAKTIHNLSKITARFLMGLQRIHDLHNSGDEYSEREINDKTYEIVVDALAGYKWGDK